MKLGYEWYRSFRSTASLIILLTLIGLAIFKLRPLTQDQQENPYKLGWKKMHPEIFKQARLRDVPVLWVMSSKAHPWGRKFLEALSTHQELFRIVNIKTLPVWTDLIQEEKFIDLLLPLSRKIISLDPHCQIWMISPEKKIISYWIPSNTSTEKLIRLFIGWVKKMTSLNSNDYTLERLHQQDIQIIKEPCFITQRRMNQQKKQVYNALKNFDCLEKLPVSFWLYGLEEGWFNLVEQTVQQALCSPYYNVLEGTFFHRYRWNSLWRKRFIDFSQFSTLNAEMYVLLGSLHHYFPKKKYNYFAKRLFHGIEKVFWHNNYCSTVFVGDEDDKGHSPHYNYGVDKISECLSLREQEIFKQSTEISHTQKVLLLKRSHLVKFANTYFSKICLSPLDNCLLDTKQDVQLRVLARLLEGARLLNDKEVQDKCLKRARFSLNNLFQKTSLKTVYDFSHVRTLFSATDLCLECFKTTQNDQWFKSGLKALKKINYSSIFSYSKEYSCFSPFHFQVQNDLEEPLGSQMIRVLWAYGSYMDQLFHGKQLLWNIMLDQSNLITNLSLDSTFYFLYLNRILSFKGNDLFKKKFKKKLETKLQRFVSSSFVL